jgi:hypothetical protein
MTGYYIALSLLALIFFTVAAVEVVLARKKLQRLRWFTKPLLVPFIIVLYLLQTGEIVGYLLAGLFTRWVGDLFLLAESKKTKHTGSGFFFLGHILYALAFIQGLPFPPSLTVELFAGILLFTGMIIVPMLKIRMEGSSQTGPLSGDSNVYLYSCPGPDCCRHASLCLSIPLTPAPWSSQNFSPQDTLF